LKGDEIHLVGMPPPGILKVSGNEMTALSFGWAISGQVIARRQTD
jgi:hypothetical protein